MVQPLIVEEIENQFDINGRTNPNKDVRDTFPDQWIERRDTIVGPSRSADLTLLDTFYVNLLPNALLMSYRTLITHSFGFISRLFQKQKNPNFICLS